MIRIKFSLSPSIFLLLMCAMLPARSSADEFGRFFTTPQQRAYLDRLRDSGPEISVEVRNDAPADQDEMGIEAEPKDSVTVKGVVYRGGGNSTAWINESNSYADDQDNKDIKMRERNIGRDSVTVELPDINEKPRIRVGETYDPNTGSLNDLFNPGVSDLSNNRRPGR